MLYYYGSGMGAGWGLLGVVLDVLWWILIIWLIVALVRGLRRGGQWRMGMHTPLDILKERYAKGEIDKKEFEEKKKDLEQ